MDFRQVGAVREGQTAEADDGGGDRDVGQAAVVLERTGPDAGDRQAVNRVRDGDIIAADAGAAGDADRVVNIGDISVCKWHKAAVGQPPKEVSQPAVPAT